MSTTTEILADVLGAIVTTVCVLFVWNWIAKPSARVLSKIIAKALSRETATA